MLIVEDGALEIANEAIDRYENHFAEVFPLSEYLNITSDKTFDITLSGAYKLTVFIDERIENNDPVVIPKGYNDRLY